MLLLIIIYLSFISLGLPDSLLGSAWPAMYRGLNAPLHYAGAVSMIIAGGTVLSSIFSEKIIRRFGTGAVTAVSVLLTAAALIGFALSPSFWLLCLFAVPLGLGGGSVDAALGTVQKQYAIILSERLCNSILHEVVFLRY
jgi:MFS family permease